MAYKGHGLMATQFLEKEDYLLSHDEKYQFILQTDGNLVLYRLSDHKPLWNSNTPGRVVTRVILQTDGNLTLYADPDHPIWASNTAWHFNPRLVVQNDAKVVIYKGDTPVWDTNQH